MISSRGRSKARNAAFNADYLQRKKKPRRFRVLKDGPYSLFASLEHHIPDAGIVTEVQFQEEGNTRFGFEYFENVSALFEHIRSLHPTRRHYFEWILKERARKPYFDIDLSCSREEKEEFERQINGFFESFMDALLLLGEEYGVEFDLERDLLIFESNGPKGDRYKFSYHIIINNWCVKDAAQSMEFARHVQLYMAEAGAEEWAERIDMSVYSNGRAFRLFLNSKVGTNRILGFLEEWCCGPRSIRSCYAKMGLSTVEKMRRVFSASIITLTSNCEAFPEFDLPERRFTADDVDDEDAEDALQLFYEDGQTNPSAFRYQKTTGSFIILKRVAAAQCAFCSGLSGRTQVHEAENAYISIFERNVYFVCRRSWDYSPNKKAHHHWLGVLETRDAEDDPETSEGGDAEEGDAERSGPGEGDAERSGPGEGETDRSGPGEGDAERRDGERSGSEGGDGERRDADRSGPGGGDGERRDADRSGPGEGDGERRDTERDDSERSSIDRSGPGGGDGERGNAEVGDVQPDGKASDAEVSNAKPDGKASDAEVSNAKPDGKASDGHTILSDRGISEGDTNKTSRKPPGAGQVAPQPQQTDEKASPVSESFWFPPSEKKSVQSQLESFFNEVPPAALYAHSTQK